MPNNVLCTYEYPLSSYDVENIGEFTRDNVQDWVDKNAGDFSEVVDFYATVGDVEIEWEEEENGHKYNDITYPEE